MEMASIYSQRSAKSTFRQWSLGLLLLLLSSVMQLMDTQQQPDTDSYREPLTAITTTTKNSLLHSVVERLRFDAIFTGYLVYCFTFSPAPPSPHRS
uniref:Putative secreted protein n=1 Tax=Anopheles marajoara TaxID=58244 RepID=A0A2M4C953_9DIPT